MSMIHLHSEPFSRDGNLAADGAMRLLGQPALSPLELVIRESIQNSWDASLETAGTPIYSIRIRRLDPDQMEAIRSFFSQLPPPGTNEPISRVLGRFLGSSGLVMEICDERTQGLDGPTSASRSLRDGESANFVNFVRNIGSARDVALGGGTYGFGKSSLFKISRCSTIIIHTLTDVDGSPEHRLIAKALGSAFDHNGRRYTGRHWWGARGDQEGGSVDPVLNDAAADLARSLGFQERNAADQRGTSMMILDPDLEELDQEGASPGESENELRNRLKARIQDTILWHCWPKFTRNRDGRVPMECRLSILGEDFSLPDPATIQPLWLLTQALAQARDRAEEFHSQRPKARLGFFGQCTASVDLQGDERFRTYLGDRALIPEKLHHIALLRPAELVVRYEEGAINQADRLQWAGVFITDIGENAEVEKAFAMSEPPAHDDWQPKSAQSLSSRQRTFVNVALRKIRERTRELSGADLTRSPFIGNDGQKSLASLAGEIGRSLIGTGPGGTDGVTRSARAGGSRGPLRISVPTSIGTTLRDGIPVATFRMRLTGDSDTDPCLSFTPWVQMDEGGKVPLAPNGMPPTIVGVEIDSQPVEFSEAGVSCPVKPGGTAIQVMVSIPDYVAIGITAEIAERSEA